jgi:hypothetical protein
MFQTDIRDETWETRSGKLGGSWRTNSEGLTS